MQVVWDFVFLERTDNDLLFMASTNMNIDGSQHGMIRYGVVMKGYLS